MASLKEIKGRIGSVEGTLKITSAMKMVASAKLHKAQQAIEGMLPYDRQLNRIMTRLVSGGVDVISPLSMERKKKQRVAVVCVASNSSLCGSYNSNATRHTVSVLNDYKKEFPAEAIDCYVIGRKLEQSLLKLKGFTLIRDFVGKGDRPSFDTAKTLADRLMEDFLAGRIDEVKLVYMHFKNTASQIPVIETYLPVPLQTAKDDGATAGYVVEPSPMEVMKVLIPDALRMKIFTMMLDAQAAEHAARTVAMQTATDNANDLLDELRILYNKGRQSAITAELLDIIGGSMH